MHPFPIRSFGANARRFEEIVLTLARYGLADWLSGVLPEIIGRRLESSDGQRLTDLSTPQRLRLVLSDLGTTFIKVGQILSTRADLIGPEIAAELTRLQSSTTPDSAADVRRMIESELGSPPETLFAAFDLRPLASASIAQVHAAKLDDGTEVAVKVQRLGIEEQIRNDLEILARLASLAEAHSSTLRIYRPRALVAQFRRQLLHELDFEREARNLERFRKDFVSDPTVAFPRPYRSFSSLRVLTMDRVVGRSIREVDKLAERGVDLQVIASRGAELYLSMVFDHGFYHADPHPGNIWLRDDGVIVLLDAGMIGRMDERLRDEIGELLATAAAGDPSAVADAVLRLGSPPASLDTRALESAAAAFIDDYADQPLERWAFSAVIGDLLAIIRQFRIHLPAEVAMLLRTLVELEGTARLLHPAFSLGEILRPHGRKSLVKGLAAKRLGRRLRRTVRDWDRLVATLPRDLSEIARRLHQGTLDVHLQHRRLDTTVNRLIYGVLTAALVLASSLLWSREIAPTIGGVSLLGTACGLLAVILSARLLRAVERSGGLGRKRDGE